MKHFVFLICFSLLVTACNLGAGYQRAVKSWVGAPVEEIIQVWGNPSETRPLENGRRRYDWNVSYHEMPSQYGGYHESESTAFCYKYIITDADGHIVEADNSYDCWQYELPAPRGQANNSGA